MVRTIIKKRIEHLMNKIETISHEICLESDSNVIENAKIAISNKKVMAKLAPIQLEFALYLNLDIKDIK